MHLLQLLDKNMQFGRYEVLTAVMKKIPYLQDVPTCTQLASMYTVSYERRRYCNFAYAIYVHFDAKH